MTTEKSKTNKKWTSNKDYRDNWDDIFKKEEKTEKPKKKKEKKNG